MCRFVETIKLNNGIVSRLKYHQNRVDKAFETFFPEMKPIQLSQVLSQVALPQHGIIKCRIVYATRVENIEFIPYVRRDIQSLKLVEMEIDSLKYKPENREIYQQAFEKKGDCDDILIIRNGFISDTSYTNIALYDGQKWVTPQIPLIYGVNRSELLNENKIFEKNIKPNELMNFQRIRLFNSMIEFGDIDLDIRIICC